MLNNKQNLVFSAVKSKYLPIPEKKPGTEKVQSIVFK